jgi:hypothetical protein
MFSIYGASIPMIRARRSRILNSPLWLVKQSSAVISATISNTSNCISSTHSPTKSTNSKLRAPLNRAALDLLWSHYSFATFQTAFQRGFAPLRDEAEARMGSCGCEFWGRLGGEERRETTVDGYSGRDCVRGERGYGQGGESYEAASGAPTLQSGRGLVCAVVAIES